MHRDPWPLTRPPQRPLRKPRHVHSLWPRRQILLPLTLMIGKYNFRVKLRLLEESAHGIGYHPGITVLVHARQALYRSKPGKH